MLPALTSELISYTLYFQIKFLSMYPINLQMEWKILPTTCMAQIPDIPLDK